MPLSSVDEFDKAFAQLGRYYRAQFELFSTTPANDKQALARWVKLAGKILEQQNEVLAEIEDWSGVADLRILLDRIKQERARREEGPATERL